MGCKRIGYGIAAATALILPLAAQARPPVLPVIPDTRSESLSDPQLDQIRGGYGYTRWQLTRTSLTAILDSQSRTEFLSYAGINGMMMDNWWNDVGAQLILTSMITPR